MAFLVVGHLPHVEVYVLLCMDDALYRGARPLLTSRLGIHPDPQVHPPTPKPFGPLPPLAGSRRGSPEESLSDFQMRQFDPRRRWPVAGVGDGDGGGHRRRVVGNEG